MSHEARTVGPPFDPEAWEKKTKRRIKRKAKKNQEVTLVEAIARNTTGGVANLRRGYRKGEE